jgi:hypothetical protein
MTDKRMEHCWDNNWQGKTKVFGEKPAAVPLRLLQILHDLAGIEPGPPPLDTGD